MVSFARLAGFSQIEGERGSKVAVLKALSGNPRLPYFCMLTQGFPRLTTVSQVQLMEQEGDVPPGALMRVRLREDDAVIPDLTDIETRLADVLASQAA